MRATTVVVLAGLAGGMAACSQQRPERAGNTEIPQDDRVAEAADARALSEAAERDRQNDSTGSVRITRPPPGSNGMAVAGTLVPAPGSAVGGSLQMSSVGSGTEVTLSLNGGAARVALHGGRCAQPGPEVAVVAAPRALGGGAAALATVADTLTLPAQTVMDGNHVLLVFGPAGDAPAACAEIPRNQPEPVDAPNEPRMAQ